MPTSSIRAQYQSWQSGPYWRPLRGGRSRPMRHHPFSGHSRCFRPCVRTINAHCLLGEGTASNEARPARIFFSAVATRCCGTLPVRGSAPSSPTSSGQGARDGGCSGLAAAARRPATAAPAPASKRARAEAAVNPAMLARCKSAAFPGTFHIGCPQDGYYMPGPLREARLTLLPSMAYTSSRFGHCPSRCKW